MRTPAATDWRWWSSRSTAATGWILGPPSAVSSSSGTAAFSPPIPSSCLGWCHLPPHTARWRGDRKGQLLVWPRLCLVCCATPPRHYWSGWPSWIHSSDGSRRLDYESTSCRRSPSLEQGPPELGRPDVRMSPESAQVEGMAGPAVCELKHTVLLVVCSL